MATPSSDGPDHAHADVNGADHVGGAGRPPHHGKGGDGGDAAWVHPGEMPRKAVRPRGL